jgi:IS30 family transposase
LDEIVREINNQPRKCLQYQTPKEAFRKELKYIKCSDST